MALYPVFTTVGTVQIGSHIENGHDPLGRLRSAVGVSLAVLKRSHEIVLEYETKQGVRVDVPGSWPAELSTRDHITFNGRVWQGGLYDAGKRENEVDRLTISCPNVLLAWFIVRMQVRTGKSQTPRGVALTLTRADGAWVI
jgi:hypothetical protein